MARWPRFPCLRIRSRKDRLSFLLCDRFLFLRFSDLRMRRRADRRGEVLFMVCKDDNEVFKVGWIMLRIGTEGRGTARRRLGRRGTELDWAEGRNRVMKDWRVRSGATRGRVRRRGRCWRFVRVMGKEDMRCIRWTDGRGWGRSDELATEMEATYS